jgi:RNA-binding protein
MADPLTGAQRRHLRALAHGERALVQLGRHGLTEAFVGELDRALEEHELVKVRLRGAERDERAQIVAELGSRLRCVPVGLVGQVAILYRPASEPDRRRIDLPSARRGRAAAAPREEES